MKTGAVISNLGGGILYFISFLDLKHNVNYDENLTINKHVGSDLVRVGLSITQGCKYPILHYLSFTSISSISLQVQKVFFLMFSHTYSQLFTGLVVSASRLML